MYIFRFIVFLLLVIHLLAAYIVTDFISRVNEIEKDYVDIKLQLLHAQDQIDAIKEGK